MNLHDCTQCAQIHKQLPSEGSTQPLEDDCEILRPMCFTLSVTLQSSILFFTRAARHYISSFLLSAIQEMNPSNDHSTCTQMTLKHKTDRHADSNIDSPFTISCLPCDPPPPNPSFLGNVQQFQIRLSHQFLPVKGKRIKKKKGGGRRKAVKMMISPSSSWGLSYAICFDIPPHQLLYLTILRGEEHKKKGLQAGENMVAGAYSITEY